MNFLNLTVEQRQVLYHIINIVVNNANQLLLDADFEFEDTQVLKLFIQFYISLPTVRLVGARTAAIEMMIQNVNYQYNVDAIINTINGTNLAGRMLERRDQHIFGQYYVNTISQIKNICDNTQNKMQTLTDIMFLNVFQHIHMRNLQNVQQRFIEQVQNVFRWANQFRQASYIKQLKQSVKEYKVSKEQIHCIYQQLRQRQNLSLKEKTFIKIFKKLKQETNLYVKNNFYLFMQYILTISNDRFEQQFNVHVNKDIEMVILSINSEIINDQQALQRVTNVNKYIECSTIFLNFSNEFQIEGIDNQIIMTMLGKIENRLQQIDGNSQFIIIKRLSDNWIFKSMITDDNIPQIEQMLQQCNDNQLYDIIIKSNHMHQNLSAVRIRHLNYCNQIDRIEITLAHPKDLISLSCKRCQISNLDYCHNVRSLFSEELIYYPNSITHLHDLKRLQSVNDIYHSDHGCMLNELFKYDNLQYLVITNQSLNSIVIDQVTISNNAKNLRVMYIQQSNHNYNINLDIQINAPPNLFIFYVDTENEGVHVYANILGKQKDVIAVKKKLIQ